MATLDELNAALVKADQAGDHQSAQIFANQIKSQLNVAPPAPAQSATESANTAGQMAGSSESDFSAGMNQAAQQGTFGLQNYINAGARYAAQRLTGQPNPDSFDADLAYARGKSEAEAATHPYSSGVGGTVGAIAGGGLVSKALTVAKTIPGIGGLVETALPKAGQPIANVAKASATGAT